MANTKISEFSSTPGNNTDIDGINIAEGCAPSGINNAIRELMSQLKDWQSGTSNDPYVIGSSGSLTLSYGTANGVPYLNGSKVLTSGSALTFDGNNLGLGVTPSAWATVKAIQYLNGAAWGVSTTDAGLSQNAYFNSGWKYISSSAAATLYAMSSGAHAWSVAPSGTAGNAISFTQAMTLDASGNLGIGTTTPNYSLTAYKAGATATYLQVANGATGAGAGNGLLLGVDTSGNSVINAQGSVNLNITVAGVQRAQIDSSGNLGVGATSPTARLHVLTSSTYAANFYTTVTTATTTRISIGGLGNGASGAGGSAAIGAEHNHSGTAQTSLTFYTHDGTTQPERARIDSSGNLLVGTTLGNFNARLTSHNSASYTFESIRTGTGNEGHVVFSNANGAVGTIFTNGSTTSYNTSSDYRLKENIQPMTGALAKVSALKPCTYKWKVDGSDGEGFIAHELQAVCPDAVTGEKDAVNEDGCIKPQGIDTSFLVATLTAAIQELKAIVDAQGAEIAALKAKA